MARQIAIFAIILIFPLLVYSQEQGNEKSLTETQVYLNLDEFEIIHLSSGIQGETIPQIMSFDLLIFSLIIFIRSGNFGVSLYIGI